MRRLCERPGCSGPASVSYGMDADERLVWIDCHPAVDPSRAGALCRRHADALRPPKGWTLDDRRDEVPRLLRVPENEVPGQAHRPPSSRSGRQQPRPQNERLRRERDDVPDLFSEPPPVETLPSQVPVEPVDDVPSTDETRAIPWVPRLGGGTTDDAPRGRLLGRAFGRRDPEKN